MLALGCTHYAFLHPLIQSMAGESVEVIEPSEAVARQVRRVLDREGLRNDRSDGGRVLYLTSGDERAFAQIRSRLREADAAIPE